MLLLPKDPHAPASERAGAHQLQRPNNHIVAGTSSMRTTVASTTAAIPIPIPTADCRRGRALRHARAEA